MSDRRQFLCLAGATAVGALAGCAGTDNSNEPSEESGPPSPGEWQESVPAEPVVSEQSADLLFLDTQQTATEFPQLYESAGFTGIAGQFGISEENFEIFMGLRTAGQRFLTIILGSFTQETVVGAYSDSGREPDESYRGYQIYSTSSTSGVAVGEGVVVTGRTPKQVVDVRDGDGSSLGQQETAWTRLLGYLQQGTIGVVSPTVSVEADLSAQPQRSTQAATSESDSSDASLTIALQYADSETAASAAAEDEEAFEMVFDGEDEELTDVTQQGREVVLSGNGSTEQALGG